VAEAVNPLRAQGFNEGRHAPYTAADIRFVTKGDALYAHVLAWPADGRVVIRSLAEGSPLRDKPVSSVTMAGNDTPLAFERTAEGMVVTLPVGAAPAADAPGAISLLLRMS
jgi:alpha-L-fucosidase